MLREPGSRDHRRPSAEQGRAANAALSKVVYRSRAVRALSAAELHDLTRVAQSRNAREKLTGVMFYDNERFYQWLEGPERAVSSVMDSIVADHRHTDVEILDKCPLEERVFGDWSMKLATPGPVLTSWRRDVIDPPSDVVEALRARPESAAALLVRLVPKAARAADTANSDAISHAPLNRTTAALLRDVFLKTVVPQLNLTGDAQAATLDLAPDRRVLELAELLLATDQQAASDLIEELAGAGARIGTVSARIFEPVARRLGDLWSEDLCSEFDVTIGLCRLQTAARLLDAARPARQASKLAHPTVLIAPEPGELHRLGAALDGTVLRSVGWAPHCEYPSDQQSLHDLLSSTWFDVLDLSLSAAFRRDHVLDQVTRTIVDARRASRNPGLIVVVGGRVFAEEKTAGATVGADFANTTAMNVNRTILNTMAATPSAVGDVTVS